jgi:hypothetical protein
MQKKFNKIHTDSNKKRVGDNMLFRNFGRYGTVVIICVVISGAMVMLLRDCVPYGIIFMTMCVDYFRFSLHS